jgi:hypothetical protein
VPASFVNFPVIETVSEGKNTGDCAYVTQSKANFVVISGKNKLFAIRHMKLQNYAINFALQS